MNRQNGKIRGLIFDFDGLILETESPVYQSWQELYRQHGLDLDFHVWSTIIGQAEGDFDPVKNLIQKVGPDLDWETTLLQRRQRELDLIDGQPILPGVEDYLQDARASGLKLAVASSSSRAWVTGHLERLGLLGYFDAIKTVDDVARAKPAPDLFLAALEALNLQPQEALVFEDSLNGLLAARRAGIRCVVVPTEMTRHLELDGADLRLHSLADVPLAHLLARIEYA